MKLLRLKINSGFRSLPKGFELYFLRDFDYKDSDNFNPYILAGRNGSGKSNVLEALAEIFYHLDSIYLSNKPSYFEKGKKNEKGFDSTKSTINNYELEYFTYLEHEAFLGSGRIEETKNHRAHIKIIKESKKRPSIEWINESTYRTPKELTPVQAKSLLPEYVVGYASGNNETLSIPFYKSRLLQYDEYLSDLEAQEFVDPRPESSLVYLDERYSQAILLTNLLMNDVSDKDNILKPFAEYVELLDVDRFRLIIRLDKKVVITLNDQEGDEEVQLLKNVDPPETKTSRITRSYIEKLKRCSTTYYISEEYEEEDYDSEDFSSDDFFTGNKKEYLTLDYKVNQATKDAFQFHFEKDSLKLFEFLQLLLSLDLSELSIEEKKKIYNSSNVFLIEDSDVGVKESERILRFKYFKIKKEKLNDPIYTKSLSDGEHQFLHAMGLCLLFRDKKALFLMDEPETHFNPDWKAKFISSLRHCLPEKNSRDFPIMREMLITSHSPFLISDSRKKYVLFFEKNKETNKVHKVERPDFQTFGSSVNRIAIRIFEMPNTIGEYAQKRFDEFELELKRLRSPKSLESLIERVKNEMGDSVERVIFVNRIIDKIESKK